MNLVSYPVEYSVPVQPDSPSQENIGFGETTETLNNIYLVSDPVEYSVPVQPGSAPQENIGFGETTETLTCIHLVSDPVEYSICSSAAGVSFSREYWVWWDYRDID
jgi:hypothetical protein